MLVIGVGNRWRRDDGAGLEVARLVREAGGSAVLVEGDLAALLDAWRGAAAAVVVDAARSGAEPGTLHRHDAAAGPLPVRLSSSSTHAFGVPEAVELARGLGRLPGSLAVVAIEGADFAAGEGLTPAVEQAAQALAGELSS